MINKNNQLNNINNHSLNSNPSDMRINSQPPENLTFGLNNWNSNPIFSLGQNKSPTFPNFQQQTRGDQQKQTNFTSTCEGIQERPNANHNSNFTITENQFNLNNNIFDETKATNINSNINHNISTNFSAKESELPKYQSIFCLQSCEPQPQTKALYSGSISQHNEGLFGNKSTANPLVGTSSTNNFSNLTNIEPKIDTASLKIATVINLANQAQSKFNINGESLKSDIKNPLENSTNNNFNANHITQENFLPFGLNKQFENKSESSLSEGGQFLLYQNKEFGNSSKGPTSSFFGQIKQDNKPGFGISTRESILEGNKELEKIKINTVQVKDKNKQNLINVNMRLANKDGEKIQTNETNKAFSLNSSNTSKVISSNINTTNKTFIGAVSDNKAWNSSENNQESSTKVIENKQIKNLNTQINQENNEIFSDIHHKPMIEKKAYSITENKQSKSSLVFEANKTEENKNISLIRNNETEEINNKLGEKLIETKQEVKKDIDQVAIDAMMKKSIEDVINNWKNEIDSQVERFQSTSGNLKHFENLFLKNFETICSLNELINNLKEEGNKTLIKFEDISNEEDLLIEQLDIMDKQLDEYLNSFHGKNCEGKNIHNTALEISKIVDEFQKDIDEINLKISDSSHIEKDENLSVIIYQDGFMGEGISMNKNEFTSILNSYYSSLRSIQFMEKNLEFNIKQVENEIKEKKKKKKDNSHL